MRNPKETIGNLIDKQSVSFISSVDENGFSMYYQGGMDGGDFIILKFTAKTGRYYSNFKSENFEID